MATSTWAIWSSTSRPISGCGFSSCAGIACIYICADDTHGTAIMIRARQEGRSEEAVIADMRAAHHARLCRLRRRVRPLRQHAQPEPIASCAASSGSRCARPAWSASATSRSFTTRRPARFWPIGSSKGPARSANRPINTAIAATNAARPIQPDRTDQPGEHAVRRHARAAHGRSLVHQYRTAATVPERMDAVGRSPCSRTWPISWRPRSCREPLRDWDVSRPAPYFGFEIPDSPGQLLVRVVRRADRLHRGHAANGATSTAKSSTIVVAQRSRPKCITSSARTSRTSTRCSGRRCSKRPASTCRARFTFTAS